jgi:beta-glucosidase
MTKRRSAVLASILGIAAVVLGVVAWEIRGPAEVPVTAVERLPADFIWGVASSAFQSEGGDIDSDWNRVNAADATQHRYGTSVDFRHRYREDVALARGLGVNTYRVGISWARVEPQHGRFDAAELTYYDDLIAALKEAGIAPMIALDHFDLPGWVVDKGGWTNAETVRGFVAYADLMARRYNEDVDLWITFNEAVGNIGAQKHNHKLTGKQGDQVRINMVEAHRQAYDAIHRADSEAVVTSNIAWLGDRRGGGLANRWSDRQFLELIKDKSDIIAIDYYGSDFLNVLQGVATHANWIWRPDPAGLYRALRTVQAQNPDKPILIAEVGMVTQDGQPRDDGVTREVMLRDTVYWTQRARADGVNVIGYMYWSLTDNFEWGSYAPRFGLFTVNVRTDPTLRRTPTTAVHAYQEIIRNNGVARDYRPVMAQ